MCAQKKLPTASAPSGMVLFSEAHEEAKSKTDVFNRMKLWTVAWQTRIGIECDAAVEARVVVISEVNFTEKHGFLGIFLLAPGSQSHTACAHIKIHALAAACRSWPNAAFDMCGGLFWK